MTFTTNDVRCRPRCLPRGDPGNVHTNNPIRRSNGERGVPLFDSDGTRPRMRLFLGPLVKPRRCKRPEPKATGVVFEPVLCFVQTPHAVKCIG